MATKAQLESVIGLHGIDDRLEIVAEYSAAEPYDITAGGSYKDQDGLHGMGDPYELANAKNALAEQYPAATVASVTVVGTLSPSVATLGGSGATYLATVVLNDGPGDETVTWSLAAVTGSSTYAIDVTGVVTSTATATENDTFDVVATSNLDGTTTGSVSVVVAA